MSWWNLAVRQYMGITVSAWTDGRGQDNVGEYTLGPNYIM